MGLQTIAIDSGDEKKKMTEELGARAFVDFATSQNVVKDVQAATADGLGPHAVLLVAVSEKPFQQAAEVRNAASCTSSICTSLTTWKVRPTSRHGGLHWPSGRRQAVCSSL